MGKVNERPVGQLGCLPQAVGDVRSESRRAWVRGHCDLDICVLTYTLDPR